MMHLIAMQYSDLPLPTVGGFTCLRCEERRITATRLGEGAAEVDAEVAVAHSLTVARAATAEACPSAESEGRRWATSVASPYWGAMAPAGASVVRATFLLGGVAGLVAEV